MTSDPIWPAGSKQLVLWAHAISVWIIASYAIAPNCIPEQGKRSGAGRRRVELLAATAFAGGMGWMLPPVGVGLYARLVLSTVLLFFVVGVGALRQKLTSVPKSRGFLAEMEIAANATFLLGSALVIGMGDVLWIGEGTASVLDSGKVTAIACVLAAAVAVFRCGTYVVRGVLDKAGAAPLRDTGAGMNGLESSETKTELSRGRSIGNLERLLMIIAIGLGRYEVLGFLVAAKGLIRSREFEDRNFAEYFILGSLASTTVALLVGIALRTSVSYFWSLEP